MSQGWIGVDFDGTLAVYDHWRGTTHVGPPIPLMVERIKAWLASGIEVRIVTARASDPEEAKEAVPAIEAWCLEHVGCVLPVTHQKDYQMMEIWDDRAVSVEKNTGRDLRVALQVEEQLLQDIVDEVDAVRMGETDAPAALEQIKTTIQIYRMK